MFWSAICTLLESKKIISDSLIQRATILEIVKTSDFNTDVNTSIPTFFLELSLYTRTDPS